MTELIKSEISDAMNVKQFVMLLLVEAGKATAARKKALDNALCAECLKIVKSKEEWFDELRTLFGNSEIPIPDWVIGLLEKQRPQ